MFGTAVDADVDELVVILGYEGSRIVAAFGDEFRDVSITYVHQCFRLGHGHAVLQAGARIDGEFLQLNGDNVFVDGITQAVEADADVDGVVAVEESILAIAKPSGVIKMADGTVTGIVENPANPPSTLITTCCLVLPEAILRACSLFRPSPEGDYGESRRKPRALARG